jgi:hypothetical protein
MGKPMISTEPQQSCWAYPRVCPICKSRALELVRTGDATGFYCKIHGHFKIADPLLDEYYTRAEWEAALRVARYEAMEGEWPVIRRGDFFR